MHRYIIKSGATVSTIIEVQQELVIGNQHILRLDYKHGGKGVPDDNIVCFDDKGKLLWTVEPCFPVSGSENPYMNIFLLDNGNLGASTWRDINVEIDLVTGKINRTSRAILK